MPDFTQLIKYNLKITSHHYRKQVNIPRSKTEEHISMDEEHNLIEEHISRNISPRGHVPRPRGTEKHKSLINEM
jgi:hypothetical protein